MRSLKTVLVVSVALATMIGLLGTTPGSATRDGAGVTRSVSTTMRIHPDRASDLKPAAAISARQLQRMQDRQHAIRLRMNSAVVPKAGPAGLALPPAAPSRAVSAPRVSTPDFHGTPGAFIVGRNNANTKATCTTGSCSTLAEPAAANEGAHVLSSGNLRHAEFSTNGGSTYTSFTFPAGPADAPTSFGDTDVIYDHSRGVTFHSIIYVNGTLTNGVVRIFVRRNIPLAANCSYTIDPGGTANNLLPDYPHLGLSNNFLYLSTNNITSGSWSGAQMRRLNVDQMADCVTASGSVATFTGPVGQRVLTPGHGARDTMFFSWVESTTQWRIFSWPDSSSTITQTLKTVSAMTFGNPDCRGGTNNTDWADSLAASITGFNVRTAIGGGRIMVLASTTTDASHLFAHIHGAILRQSDLALLSQPVVFFTDRCAGLKGLGSNDRGDFGVVAGIGGKAGGGGPAVAPAAWMIDEFSPGPGGFSLTIFATATHNPTNLRYGDYFTVRRNAPSGEFFDATGYGFNGGTSVTNINSRYIEFGRGRDAQGYFAWNNAIPAT